MREKVTGQREIIERMEGGGWDGQKKPGSKGCVLGVMDKGCVRDVRLPFM